MTNRSGTSSYRSGERGNEEQRLLLCSISIAAANAPDNAHVRNGTGQILVEAGRYCNDRNATGDQLLVLSKRLATPP